MKTVAGTGKHGQDTAMPAGRRLRMGLNSPWDLCSTTTCSHRHGGPSPDLDAGPDKKEIAPFAGTRQ